MMLGTAVSWGQVSITSTGTAFTQNFDTMGSGGTAALPTGFRLNATAIWSSGTTATTQAGGTSGTGALTSSSTGGSYNFANGVTASSTDRAVGFLTSSSFGSPRAIIYAFTNNTGATITGLNIAYNYEKYRTGSRAFNFTFVHGSSASTALSTSATEGDQAYAADGGNAVVNPPTSVSKSFSLTGLSIANGSTYYLAWNYAGVGGGTNAQGLGLDNFSITAVGNSSYTVTYNGNTSTGGTAPTDSTSYAPNASVTVLGQNTLIKTGYTFLGWNTLANGNGTTYNPGDTFDISANTTLYAKWAINTYTLTYTAGANGSIAGSTPQTVNHAASGTAVTAVPDPGYHFVKWSDDSTQNPRTDSNVTANVSVTASFALNTYTVAYDGNGSTGGATPIDPASPYDHGSTVTVLLIGDLVKTGYTFAGWNTAANGSGTAYQPSATFTATANTTLFAQWTINTYTISYDGNGNTGGTAPVDPGSPYNYNTVVTILAPGSLVKAGNTFFGWNTAADGSGTSYLASATFAITANTTLFAQWTSNPTVSGATTTVAFTTTYGTASIAQAFPVSGINLTTNLVATAPAGFEVSSNGTTYGPTAQFVPASGSASGTLSIRLAANAPVTGAYDGKAIELSSTGATSVNITTAPSGNSVTAKSVTISGLTSDPKIYTATTDATFTGTAVLDGVVAGDEANVTLSGSGAASFTTAAVGAGKTVNVTGYTLAGSSASNYSLALPVVLHADITAAPLTISGLTVNPKTYNGTTTGTVSGGTLNGVQGTDNVGFTAAATFADANVGTGIAVSATVILTGTTAGNYTITQPTGLTGDITKADQTITFGTIPTKQPGDAPFDPGATASSSLAVSYSSDNEAVATVSGNLVTIVSSGTANITASQAGSGNYNAATPVTKVLTVSSGPTTLAAGDVAVLGYNSANPDALAVVLLRDIGPSTVINFTDNGFSSTTTGNTSEGFLTYTAPTAQPAGTVLKWTNGMVVTGTGWSSGAPSNFAFNGTSDQLFVFQGATANWATQNGIKVICGANFGAALLTSGTAGAGNTYQPSAAILPGTAFLNLPTAANGYFANGATSVTSVTVAGSPASLLALFVDSSKWFGQSGLVSFPIFSINFATAQTIDFATLDPKTFGDTSFDLSATASSGLPVSFASSNQAVATVSGNTVTIVGAGTTTITASQAGNGTFGPATDVPQTLTVAKASQTITFGSLTNRTYGDASFDVLATSDSNLAVSFASSNQAVATISGKAVTIVGAGTTTITASQTGTTNYNAALDVPQTLTVDPKALTVTANNVTKAFGLALFGPVSGSTAFSSLGLVAGNAIDTVTITYGTGAAADAAVGTYTGSVVASNAAGSVFNPSNYSITYVAGDINVSSTPTLSVNGPLSGQTTIYGTASGGTSFIVSGGNLSGNVTVSAPAGYELQGGGALDFTPTVSLTPAGNGTLSATVTLRLAATASAGAYSGSVSVSGGSASAQTLPIPASSVQTKGLTITGLTGVSRPYDTTNGATFTGTPAYSGLENGENFSVTGTATATFANKTVGNAKTITVAGFTAPSANYTVTQPTLSGDITAVALTVNGAAVTTKTFDGTTAATITGTLTGVLGTDNVSFVGTGTFASASPGIGIAVTSTSTLSGPEAGNYTLTQPTGLTGTITASSNANLSSLTLSAGTLTPAFASATTSYTASVMAVPSITVTPTVSDAGATVTVNTTAVTSGSASGAINLNPGDNTITVTVTAADLITTKTYTVIVHRWAGYTAGNLVLFQADSATGNNTTANIVEVTPSTAGQTSATAASTIAINGTTAPNALRFSGSATSTGYLSTSADGSLLTFNGHKDTATGVNANTLTSRAVGTLNVSGSFNLAATYTGVSGQQTRSSTSLDNSTWYIGDQSGLFTNGATTPSPTANIRSIRSFGGVVYAFQASASVPHVLTVSAPTGGTLTGLPGLPNGATTGQDFYLISSGDNGTNYDVLYILGASSNTVGSIAKYSLVGGTWTANGTYTTAFGGFGLTAADSGNGAVLYVTTGQGALAANSLLKLTDTAGFNQTINITTANNVTLYTAPTGTVVKGVAFAPIVAVSRPDLTVNLSAPGNGFTGTNFDYTLAVANGGAADATGIAVNFSLPAGLTFVSASGTNGFSGVNNAGVVNFTGGSIAAGASATLTVTVNAATAATYTAAIGAAVVDPLAAIIESNEANNASPTGASTIVDATVVAAQITTEPVAGQNISTGTSATLTVTATGAPTPTYQWYRGASGDTANPVNGATSPSFTTPVLIAAASYWVRVSNSGGSDDSQTANITVSLAAPYTNANVNITSQNRVSWNPNGVNVGGTQFVNLGLQGVGRVPANSVDLATGETLGSISDMQITNFVNNGNGSWTGTFNFLPDRGYNSGAIFSNYAARLNVFNFTFTPYTSSATTTAQNQIAMTFQGSTRFTYDHDGNPNTPPVFTTGLNADATASLFGTTVPVAGGLSTQSDGPVTNRLTLDSEGLVFDNRAGKTGAGWIGDEYGASIYHFNSSKQIDGQLILPAALIPHKPAGTTNFNGTPTNGRRDNQGMEGVAQSPDGTKLFGLMQSATIQDSGSGNEGRYNTRLLVYDITGSDTPTDPIAQYVIQLPRIDTDGNGSVDRTGAQSSILALNDHQILILSRDGNGRGATGSPVFKSILLADLNGATNIDGAYDAEGNQVSPSGTLLPAITPMSWTEALNLLGKLDLNISEVEKFGLNFNTAPGDINSICEKWEALSLVSAQDPANPNDYFLFVGNDNDFLTSSIKYFDASGTLQTAAGALENDTLVLAYRVRLSGPELVVEQPTGTNLNDGTSTVSFGNVPFDSTATRTFTVKNVGNANLTGLGITVTGTDAGLFTVTANPAAPVAAAGSTTFSVKFTPGALGAKSAVLHLASNDFDEGSFEINLAGTGDQLAAPVYQLQNATYTVAENAGTLTVNVLRTGSTPAADVTFTTTDGSAHAGTDFTAPATTVHFNEGDTSVPVSIPIANLTGTAQGTRGFTVALTAVPNGSSIGALASATISITDIGGAGAFTLVLNKIDVNPLNPTGLPNSVEVVVTRTGSAAGAATITLRASEPQTVAKPLVKLTNVADYTLINNISILSFTDGQLSKTLSIPLKTTVHNGQFLVTLSAPTNGATLGAITSATVEVLKKDTTNPTLNVVFGPASGGQATISGTATDGGAVSSGINRVEIAVVSVNSPAPTPVSLPLTAGAFSTNVQLQHGTNKVTVTAFDNSGRKIAKSFTYSYSNSVLTALAGTYTGLLVPVVAPTNDNSGFLTVTVSKTAAISGKLTISGISASFSGALDNTGTLYFKKTASPKYPIIDKTEIESYLGTLSLSISGNQVAAALLTEEGGSVLSTATALPVVALTDPGVASASAGQKYTLLFPSKAQTGILAANYPQGDGYASVSVKLNGSVSAVGVLADGTAYSASGKLHPVSGGRQNVPLHLNLYKKKGSFATELSFDVASASNVTADDVTGTNSLWLRPLQTRARYYPNGWPGGARVDAVGSRFTATVGASVLPGLGAATPNAQLQFADGGLTGLLTRDFDISATNAFKNQSADTGLKLSITKSTGVFTGTFTPPASSKLTFKGIILQEGANQRGFGFFLSAPVPAIGGVGYGGGVTLTPHP